ncbi:hypothetical protein ACJX0J_033951, partial [Zea mays]
MQSFLSDFWYTRTRVRPCIMYICYMIAMYLKYNLKWENKTALSIGKLVFIDIIIHMLAIHYVHAWIIKSIIDLNTSMSTLFRLAASISKALENMLHERELTSSGLPLETILIYIHIFLYE